MAWLAKPPTSGNCDQELGGPSSSTLVEVRERAGRGKRPRPPTRGQIDIWLSLRITSRFSLQDAGIVERFEDDARRQGAVADDRDRMRSPRPSRSSPTSRPSMADTEQPAWPVMNRSKALSCGIGIAHQAALGADGVELEDTGR